MFNGNTYPKKYVIHKKEKMEKMGHWVVFFCTKCSEFHIPKTLCFLFKYFKCTNSKDLKSFCGITKTPTLFERSCKK